MIFNLQVIADLTFLTIGLVYGAMALSLPNAAFGNPAAPKIYPMIIAAGIMILSTILLAGEVRRQKAGKSEPKLNLNVTEEGKLVALVSIACVIYALVFELAGYVVSTFLFLIVIMIYISKGKKLLSPVLWSLGFSVGVYYVFSRLLGITLPPMPFLNI